MRFFIQHWAGMGAATAVMFLVFLFTNKALPKFSLEWLLWLHLPVYMVHQVEEYLFPGRFRESLNDLVTRGSSRDTPLSETDCWAINVVLVWGGILAGAALFPDLRLASWMLGVTFINGMVHLGSGIARKAYNPGMATAALLHLPFAGYVLFRLFKEAALGWEGLGWAAAAGFVVHIGIIAYVKIKERLLPA